MSDVHLMCRTCGLLGGNHRSKVDCIHGLRAAMVAQSRAAEGLAFDVSTRFMAILERLAHDPAIAGVVYTVATPDGKGLPVPPQLVREVMTAIYHRYVEMCDWSPLKAERERADKAEAELSELKAKLAEAG